jgi:pyrimidine deaminase RibD-like protein
MILNDFAQPKSKFSNDKLDVVLAELCGLVLQGQREDPELNGRVGAAVLDPRGRLVTGVGYKHDGKSVHGEYSAIENYENEYGKLPKGCIIITTLSPCNESHDKTAAERYGQSCTDLLNSKYIKMAYCGYGDYTQDGDQHEFTVVITSNDKIKELCKKIADTFLKRLSENTNKQILSYIKKIHPKGEFNIAHSVMNHAEWELTSVPLSDLHIDTDEVSPYDQINYIDYDHVANITAQDIKNKPIVADNEGWIIDGNHRAVAARNMGMTRVPAYVPVESDDDDEETYDQHMARINKERTMAENFADGKGPGRPGDSQRHGIPKGATMAELQKASHSKGRKGQLARWQINMRKGKKK